MDISFVKDGIATVKKKPIIIVIFIAALAGLFLLSRGKKSTSSDTVQYDTLDDTQPTTGSVTGLIGQAQAQTLSSAASMDETNNTKIMDLLDKMTQANEDKFGSLDQTISGQNENFMNQILEQNTHTKEQIDTAITKTDEHITNVESKIDTARETQVIPQSNKVDTAYNDQIFAYTKIKKLGQDYETAKAGMMKDNVLSDTEKTSLEAIHQEAERTGIAAGFGAGGEGGSLRVIPDAVKKAVNGG